MATPERCCFAVSGHRCVRPAAASVMLGLWLEGEGMYRSLVLAPACNKHADQVRVAATNGALRTWSWGGDQEVTA